MNKTVMQTAVKQDLTDLWNRTKQESIIHFLRRAVRADQTLAELAAALRFASAEADIQGISLQDVLSDDAPVVAPRPSPVTHLPVPAPRIVPPKRPRRTAEDGEALKVLLLAELAKSADGITTPKLLAKAQQAGHAVDVGSLALILGKLTKSGELISDDGRPKTWRLKPRGRSVPEPVIIRKAQRPVEEVVVEETPAAALDVAAEPESPAEPPPRINGLMSPEEIKAAAAALQAKFFAVQGRS